MPPKCQNDRFVVIKCVLSSK